MKKLFYFFSVCTVLLSMVACSNNVFEDELIENVSGAQNLIFFNELIFTLLTLSRFLNISRFVTLSVSLSSHQSKYPVISREPSKLFNEDISTFSSNNSPSLKVLLSWNLVMSHFVKKEI